MHSISRNLKHCSVGIIGAGLSGCILACELKDAGYEEVVIFETKDDICKTSSQVVSELHSGAEYPYDLQSGKDCLRGLIAFKKLFPKGIFRKPRTQFIISSGALRNGLNDDMFSSHCLQLQKEYEQILVEDPSAKTVLGSVEDFWKKLSPNVFDDVINAEYGYETPQHGIEPYLVINHIHSMLKQKAVKVRLRHSVIALEQLQNNFQIVVDTPDGIKKLSFSQIAFADHFSGLSMMQSIANYDLKLPEIYAALRMIVLARHKINRPFPRPSRFMLEGRNGAMDGPIASDLSLVYQPYLSHIDKIKLDKNYRVPDHWRERMIKPTIEDFDRAKSIVTEAATIAYPYLSKSSVENCYIRIAINTVQDSRQRRNPGVLIPTENCVSLALTTKATCAVLNAQNAAKILKNQLLG